MPLLSFLYTLIFVSERDSSFCQVVGRHLNFDLIAWQYFDVVHTHFPWDMSCNYMPILQFHPEHCIRQSLDNGSVLFYKWLFWHISVFKLFDKSTGITLYLQKTWLKVLIEVFLFYSLKSLAWTWISPKFHVLRKYFFVACHFTANGLDIDFFGFFSFEKLRKILINWTWILQTERKKKEMLNRKYV